MYINIRKQETKLTRKNFKKNRYYNRYTRQEILSDRQLCFSKRYLK